MRATLIGALLLFVPAGLACRADHVVPEAGAALVRVTSTPSAPRPDELRVWAYDDGGTLWDGVRVPDQGPLVAPATGSLGTILIQPGAMRGALRVHIRAFAEGARILDGVASIAEASRDHAIVDLSLQPEIPADADGDDVPDKIDDCLEAANPAQGGCSSTLGPDGSADGAVDGGSPDAAAGDDGAPHDADGGPVVDATSADSATPADAATAPDEGADGVGAETASDASTCEGGTTGGGCGQPAGTMCRANGDCASGACADGVCCDNACLGACRSCNQPDATGTCRGYVLGTDPERECGNGTTCNGAGACGAPSLPNKPNGQACVGGNQCLSGFCIDGVCCNTACGDPCLSCTTGTCQAVQRSDDVPQCAGTMTCNNKGKCVGA